MKAIMSIISISLMTVSAFAIPHLPIDSAGPHYQAYVQSHMGLFRPMDEVQDALQPVVAMGERNLEWLKEINKNLHDEISLTTPENMQAFPIESPRIYNEQIVLDEFAALKKALPVEMSDILFSNKNLPKGLPLSREEYIDWAFKVDRTYQIAVRWKMMLPYLNQLAGRKFKDVRGYYFLKDITNLDDVLNNYDNLSADQKQEIRIAMIRVCNNTRGNEIQCERDFNSALAISGGLVSMKNRFWSNSKKVWDAYFEIPRFSTYSGMRWPTDSPNVARVPFRQTNPEIMDFLKVNIEDEFQWGDWKLIADFDLASSNSIRVIFQPGITPHVKGLGTNAIYMDSNTPLNQWDVQWTIRHEFGHNLGIPDCYHEFYDTRKRVIIGYQIDIDDLMCSRRGVFQQRHFDQLKAAYYGR